MIFRNEINDATDRTALRFDYELNGRRAGNHGGLHTS